MGAALYMKLDDGPSGTGTTVARVGKWAFHARVCGSRFVLEHETSALRVKDMLLPPGDGTLNASMTSFQYDTARRELTAQRGTMTGLPLYYANLADGGFACATSVAGLSDAGARIEEDPSVLPECLLYRCVLPPRTLFKGIRQLACGDSVRITLGDSGKWKVVHEDYSPPREENGVTLEQTAEVGENLLPLCHREAALIKRWLGGTHQGAVSHEHLSYYLDEYTFRFNRRTSQYRGKLFHRLLQNAVAVQPIGYRDIVLAVRGQRPRHNI